ncbi:MAG: restriction endonuclease subunit S, partial [Synergistaceae bacterium]|nr:restriction endonuclease subunit S [Synergistaceae bacterium]
YNPARINIGSLALSHDDMCIVSPMYVVFEVADEEKLLPEYLMLWLDRAETQRYAGFVSIGTTRDIFSFNDMCEVKIPIPDITIQRSIANIYTASQKRKSLAERLKTLTKDICPILIKGAIDEATR